MGILSSQHKRTAQKKAEERRKKAKKTKCQQLEALHKEIETLLK